MRLLQFGNLALISVVSSSAVPFLGYDRRVARDVYDKHIVNGTTQSCLNEAAPIVTAPKTNPWAPLTPDQNFAVWNLLHDPSSGLNLTDPNEATLTDNYV